MEKNKNAFSRLAQVYYASKETFKAKDQRKPPLSKANLLKKPESNQSLTQKFRGCDSNLKKANAFEVLLQREVLAIRDDLKEIKGKFEGLGQGVVKNIQQSLEIVKGQQTSSPAQPFEELNKLKQENYRLRQQSIMKENDFKKDFQRLNEMVENQARTIQMLQKEKLVQIKPVPVYNLSEYKELLSEPNRASSTNKWLAKKKF